MNTKSKQKSNKQSSIKQKNSTRLSSKPEKYHTRSVQHQQKQQKRQSKKYTLDRHQQYIHQVYLRDDQQHQEESVAIVQTKTINTKYRRSKRIRNINTIKSKQLSKIKSKRKQAKVIENQISFNEESIDEYNPVNERKNKRKTRRIKKYQRPQSRRITRNRLNLPQRELPTERVQNSIYRPINIFGSQPRQSRDFQFTRVQRVFQSIIRSNNSQVQNPSDSSPVGSIPLQNSYRQQQAFNNFSISQQIQRLSNRRIDNGWDVIRQTPPPVLLDTNFQWFFSKNKILKSSQLTIEQLQQCDRCIICFESFIKQQQQQQQKQKQQKQQKQEKQQEKQYEKIKQEKYQINNLKQKQNLKQLQKQQQYVEKIDLLELFCAHFFHKQCIYGWLKGKDRPHCPCCRKDFRKYQQYQQWDKNYRRRINPNEIIQFNEMRNHIQYQQWAGHQLFNPLFSQFRAQNVPSFSRGSGPIVIEDSDINEQIRSERIHPSSAAAYLTFGIQRDGFFEWSNIDDQVEQIQMQDRRQLMYEYRLSGWNDNQQQQNSIVNNQNHQNTI